MTPIDAFKKAMFYISGVCSSLTLNKPGAVIERLSTESRDALKELKSSDIGPEQRIDDLKYYAASEKYYRDKEWTQDRLDFDKKILK